VDTVNDVIARMREVDAALPDEDGLKWFNMLYLMVTEEIGRDLAAARWADGPWLERLDVVFARLYFEAIVAWVRDRARCPRAWVALFEARRRRGVARVQYGIAGMNAHINRDLPVAVVRSCEDRNVVPTRGTPQHADYERINEILEEVEIRAMQRMATGIIGKVSDGLGRLDDVLAMWKVRKARDGAWSNAEVQWALRGAPAVADHHLAALDRMAGFAGRAVLVPTEVV
jgi:hypothetical protein